ncbi:hypothetical protein [Parabacteroides johnsonii]|uniref:hypothetical protein n=1 Tax=Parabacteroides johnsonii TaxID=387661 RepID=UPI001651EA2F|nr:hypothetical protein [Parabacteroides johnsonii]
MNIRTLNADEIECRVQQITEKGCSLLLYKDARVDMKLLDEVFGPMGWQRSHELINGQLFCNIDIWDADKKCWIRKQDVGTESNTEAEKGRASDSFKRAGFNVGIGRELYTVPFIWIPLSKEELISKGSSKWSTYTKFSVKEIKYNDKREIVNLIICDNKGNERYRFPHKSSDKITTQTKESSSLKKTFNLKWLNMPEFMKWMLDEEIEAKNKGVRFSLRNLIDSNYRIDDNAFNVLTNAYIQYKTNNNLS